MIPNHDIVKYLKKTDCAIWMGQIAIMFCWKLFFRAIFSIKLCLGALLQIKYIGRKNTYATYVVTYM